MDTAQVITETGKIVEPEAIRVAPSLPGPFEVLIEDAYAAVKAKLKAGVAYDIAFVRDDGGMFRRFSRKAPREAWLRARPINPDGKTDRSEDSVVFPIAVSLEATDDTEDLETQFEAELAAAKRVDV